VVKISPVGNMRPGSGWDGACHAHPGVVVQFSAGWGCSGEEVTWRKPVARKRAVLARVARESRFIVRRVGGLVLKKSPGGSFWPRSGWC
jgi:hypothetical protein